MVEKQIWFEIWDELHDESYIPLGRNEPRNWNNFYDDIKNHFADKGRLNSDAKVRRFDKAMQVVREKIWKMVPRYLRELTPDFKG